MVIDEENQLKAWFYQVSSSQFWTETKQNQHVIGAGKSTFAESGPSHRVRFYLDTWDCGNHLTWFPNSSACTHLQNLMRSNLNIPTAQIFTFLERVRRIIMSMFRAGPSRCGANARPRRGCPLDSGVITWSCSFNRAITFLMNIF